ncbi:MAG: hypothetical protein KIS72_04390 [Luteimonas sp.]|nr:hypothetical protein [Luteimonas sp.]
MKVRMLATACAAMLALGACATGTKLSDAEERALYDAHAGAPVDSFSFFGRLNGWTPLGDSALVVWTKPNEAWLLDLTGPCPDMEYTPAIGLTSNMHRVYARFDKVIANGPGSMNMPCFIQQIRPLDVKAVRASEKELREARVQARDSATP